MLVNLETVLRPAMAERYGVAAFNVYGYEEARACVDAAEDLHSPVILAASMTFARHMPLPTIAFMLKAIAQDASVPVCVHLDHGRELDTVFQAVDLGFSSVMYDGADLALPENIANARLVVGYAHERGVSVEAAVGSIPDPSPSLQTGPVSTRPGEARRMVEESGIDVLAVSVGNIHHLERQAATIDFARLMEIRSATSVPLVMHGASGIFDEDLTRLAGTSVCKFNIGTTLRRTLGSALRHAFEHDPAIFDRIQLMRSAMAAVRVEAKRLIRLIGSADADRRSATLALTSHSSPQ